MTDSTPTPPAGLKDRGRAFWDAVTAEFDFTDSETALLLEACRTLDNLDALADAVAAYGPMVEGSQGQPTVNPALTEARGQRLALHRLLTALALPDEDGVAIPTGRQMSAKSAAKARWNMLSGPTVKAAK